MLGAVSLWRHVVTAHDRLECIIERTWLHVYKDLTAEVSVCARDKTTNIHRTILERFRFTSTVNVNAKL